MIPQKNEFVNGYFCGKLIFFSPVAKMRRIAGCVVYLSVRIICWSRRYASMCHLPTLLTSGIDNNRQLLYSGVAPVAHFLTLEII